MQYNLKVLDGLETVLFVLIRNRLFCLLMFWYNLSCLKEIFYFGFESLFEILLSSISSIPIPQFPLREIQVKLCGNLSEAI